MDLKNFKTRTLTAIIYAGLCSILILLNEWSYLVFCLISFVWLSIELKKIIHTAKYYSWFYTILVTGIIAILISFFNAYFNLSANYFLLLIIPFYSIFILELFSSKNNSIPNISVSIFYFAYILLPLIFSIYLTSDIIVSNKERTYTPDLLFATLILIWIFDSSAYIFGVLFGKRKLYEKVSPHKSWEGFIAGTIFTILIAALAASFIKNIALVDLISMSLIVVIFGTLGDLIESKFKRSINIKDSGNTLPGHGGLLDRLDSFIFVIPWIFLYFIIRTVFSSF